MSWGHDERKSSTAFKLIIFFLLLIVGLSSIGFWQVRTARPFVLVNLSMSSSWSWRGMSAVPFPFRSALAVIEFKRRSLDDLRLGSGISNVYAVLGFGSYDHRFDGENGDKNRRLADILLNKGMSINAPDKYDCTPLQQAVINRDESSFHYLVEKGALWEANQHSGGGICSRSVYDLLEEYLPKSAPIHAPGAREKLIYSTSEQSTQASDRR